MDRAGTQGPSSDSGNDVCVLGYLPTPSTYTRSLEKIAFLGQSTELNWRNAWMQLTWAMRTTTN